MKTIIFALSTLLLAAPAEGFMHYQYSPFVDMYRNCKSEDRESDISCQCLTINVEKKIEHMDVIDLNPVEREQIIRYAALDCMPSIMTITRPWCGRELEFDSQ